MPSRVISTPTRTSGYVPLVEIWRGECVESIHFGALAVVDSAGRLIASAGDPETVIFLRSAAKPAQVLPLLASGGAERFGFAEAEIAVMIGSHGGEPFHVAAVRSILAKIGLEESALQCGPHAPYHRPSARALRAAGSTPSPVHNNCSGKHAGMLALARHLGAPLASYLEESHPGQRRIRAAVEVLAGLRPGAAGSAIDGCSAPTFAVPLRSAAFLYARLAAPGRGLDELEGAARRAVTAMGRHPEMVAGTDRLCTALMRSAGQRLIAKIGAEGVYGLAFERKGAGIGIALKIADGDGRRARSSVALEALRQLGALPAEVASDFRSRFVGEIRNHRGLVVGRVTTRFDLAPPERAS